MKNLFSLISKFQMEVNIIQLSLGTEAILMFVLHHVFIVYCSVAIMKHINKNLISSNARNLRRQMLKLLLCQAGFNYQPELK